jgi:hypothetical protein
VTGIAPAVPDSASTPARIHHPSAAPFPAPASTASTSSYAGAAPGVLNGRVIPGAKTFEVDMNTGQVWPLASDPEVCHQ